MVIRPGHTRAVEARAAIDYLQRAGTHIVGVVLNYIPRNWTKYYEGYYLPSEYATGKQK
jgi:Mrp family chromosome partitioning ATPase